MKKYAILLLSVLLMGCLETTEPSNKMIEKTPSNIIETAREKLADHLGSYPDAIELLTAEKKIWPNGALGCPQKGAFYQQMIIEGYLLKFYHEGNTYNIHEGRGKYILCLTDKAQLL